MTLTQDLERESAAASSLVANIRDAVGEDEDFKIDMIEAETGLKEVLEIAAERLVVLDAHMESLKAAREQLSVRLKRFERQDELLRTAIVTALAQAELKKIELPSATLTRAPSPPKVIVTDEQAIPAAYWKRADPTLDKRKLSEALKDGTATIPGAELSNGGDSLRVRFA